MNKKQVGINLIAGLISCAATLGVSFVLTQYLVAQLGDEAYGYIGLSSQFVTIATVFTTALNSMANRFILIAYEKRDAEKVKEYYSSLFVGGLVLAVVFLAAGFLITGFLEKIFNISPQLVVAAKITFALSVVNFAIMTLFNVFTSATFIRNRLALNSRGEILANLAKVCLLAFLFTTLRPQIYFATLGGLLYTVVLYGNHIINTHKLLPELRINLRCARLRTVRELVSAGSWNALNSIIQLLMVGMDLAIANWFLDGRAMGLLSVSNTITVACSSVLTAVTAIFYPVLYRTYAQGDMLKLHQQVQRTTRIECGIMYVPIAGLMVFGSIFYTLWMPYKSAEDICLLAGITILKVWDQFTGLTMLAARSNFTMYNQLRPSALGRFALSILNLPLVLLLMEICPFYVGDVLIIAGVSSLLYNLYYWGIEVRLISRVTGQPVKDYYNIIVREIVLFACLAGVYLLLLLLWGNKVTSWVEFLVMVSGAGFLGYVIVWFAGINREDRTMLLGMIQERFVRNNRQ